MERSGVYFAFIENYPYADFIGYVHQNGYQSEVAVGGAQGKVEEVFIGVYRDDGSRIAEHLILESMLELPETLNTGDSHLPRRAGELRAEGFAGSPITSI